MAPARGDLRSAFAGPSLASDHGSQISEPAYSVNSFGSFSASPINMGSGSDQVYLTLYGTGFAAAGASNVKVTVNGVNALVLYAGSSGFTGVDQVNVQLPAGLVGAGNVSVQLTASGVAANTVQITIQ